MCRLLTSHSARLRQRPVAVMRSERRTGTCAPRQHRRALLEVAA